ncbi:hypothetical protein EUGRSUZ_L03086 [Eucalyptus grandis]|uniref:Uncharacterized protein n=1 Tax=Eucalyptus grandis TaxID=71139 RepID=A0AAD9WIG8_EUCGR|nr:hypothetical protein EUGRSUZ_L03086 [Eucalyptus grandis]
MKNSNKEKEKKKKETEELQWTTPKANISWKGIEWMLSNQSTSRGLIKSQTKNQELLSWHGKNHYGIIVFAAFFC